MCLQIDNIRWVSDGFQLVSKFKLGWVDIFLNAQSLAIRAVAEAFGSVSLAVLPSQGHSSLTKCQSTSERVSYLIGLIAQTCNVLHGPESEAQIK